jgi:hypothetical protein
MKTKILLFAALFLTLNTWSQTKINVSKATAAPAIDGVVDVSWLSVTPIAMTNILNGIPTVTPTWRAMWDDDAFYLLIEVEDDVVAPLSSPFGTDTRAPHYDKAEVYFDINDVLIDGLGPNSLPSSDRTVKSNGHFQSAPNMDAAIYGQENIMTATDFRNVETVYSYRLTSKGYNYEAKYSWNKLSFPDGSTLTGTTALNRQIGFEVVIIDRDLPEQNRQRMIWHWTSGSEPWTSMDGAGIIICTLPTNTPNISNNPFKVYPNPAQHYITVENALNANFRLFDITGKVLIDKTIVSQKDNLDISYLKSGIYFMSIGGITQKLLVE